MKQIKNNLGPMMQNKQNRNKYRQNQEITQYVNIPTEIFRSAPKKFRVAAQNKKQNHKEHKCQKQKMWSSFNTKFSDNKSGKD